MLLEHIAQHFADEEAILLARNYKGLSVHAGLHKALLASVVELRKESADGSLSISKLVEFLVTEVVTNHMLKEDKKFFGLFDGLNAEK